jgi:hypothetical protein
MFVTAKFTSASVGLTISINLSGKQYTLEHYTNQHEKNLFLVITVAFIVLTSKAQEAFELRGKVPVSVYLSMPR